MAEILDYLKEAVQRQASDLFIVAGGPVSVKQDKQLLPLTEEKIFPQETQRLIGQLYEQAGRSMDEYLRRGDDDFSFSSPGLARFRVNTYRQRGSLAAVVRIVAFDIPDWKDLHIPSQVMDLADKTDGLILVTGRSEERRVGKECGS